MAIGQKVERRTAIARRDGVITCSLQPITEYICHIMVVIDDENPICQVAF